MRCHCNEEAFLRGEKMSDDRMKVTEEYDCEFQECSFVKFVERKADKYDIQYFVFQEVKEVLLSEKCKVRQTAGLEVEGEFDRGGKEFIIAVHVPSDTITLYSHDPFGIDKELMKVEVKDKLKLPKVVEETLRNTQSSCIFL